MATRNPELRQRFGIALKEARARAGLSQEELGERAGLHSTYISQLERGLKSPSLDALFALATAVGLSAHGLVETTEAQIRESGRRSRSR